MSSRFSCSLVMGCVHAFRRQLVCKSCGIVVMIFSVGNSVGTSSCKLSKPPSGVYAASPHIKWTRRCPSLRPPRSCRAWAARVVHLDHGYLSQVKMMSIQRMTYCPRLRVEVFKYFEYCVSLLTVISPAADKRCVLEYRYFPPLESTAACLILKHCSVASRQDRPVSYTHLTLPTIYSV